MSRHSPETDLILHRDSKILIGDDQPDSAAGWRDLVGQALVRKAAGVGVPVWTQMGTSPFYGYVFDYDDEIQFVYHIDHDYAEGTPIYLHAHWTSDGTNVATVKWEFTWTFAKGHQQAQFDIVGGGEVVTVEQAGLGTAWSHMIAEIAAPGIEPTGGFEPDGILMLSLKRITNGASNNPDNIFLVTGDCHYQADKFATKNKAPDFNA